MGAINYKRNKYITLGMNIDEYMKGIDVEELDELEYYNEITDYFMELEGILHKYNFKYFEVALVDGYYDGFYLDIKDEEYVYFDDTKEKNETLKEATKLKELMLEVVENGLVACFPGWVTTYLGTQETIKEVNRAIKEIKKDIQAIPTYRNYKKIS